MKYFVGVEVDAESPEVAQAIAEEIFASEEWSELIVSAKDEGEPSLFSKLREEIINGSK